MQHISSIELQNIRHLIGAEMVTASKARMFAGQVNDQQLRTYLDKKARGAEQNIQRLEQFLMG